MTRRFPTILGLILLLAAAGLGIWYLQTSKPKVAEDIIPSKIKITNVADNKFTVSWVTAGLAEGTIEYGPVGQKLGQAAMDDRDQDGEPKTYLTHHVTIPDLQPSTQYAFRILSGDRSTRFDNNGSPYSVTTGPTISTTPTSKSLYGDVSAGAQLPTDIIVYLGLPGAAPVSTLVTASSKYVFTVSTVRTADLQKYIEYDPAATVANITAESGNLDSLITVTMANAEPVPLITLGQDDDFRSERPTVAQVEPETTPAEVSPMPSAVAETPGIFNVEPLSGNEPSTGGTQSVSLLNPEEDGEQVATTRPEFRGTGPGSTVLSITVRSAKPYADSVVVDGDGTWSWSPPADLEPGEHTVTIAYIDTAGIERVIERSFFVQPALAAQGDPAFEATPSASVRASATPSPSPSAKASPTSSPGSGGLEAGGETGATLSPSPREGMPSTESGVPVTGLFSTTLLTGLVGLVIMVIGALMLAI